MTYADVLLHRMRRDEGSAWVDRLLDNMERWPSPLSPREREVLRCASVGLTEAQTADMCGRSVDTIKNQLTSARRKLLAKNTAHAACEAIRLGLIP